MTYQFRLEKLTHKLADGLVGQHAIRSGMFLLVGYATLLTVLGGAMAWKPGQFGFALDGDGAKNYYTFHYHVLHGSGVWFDGMNYPLGDHIIYADAQPLLALPFSWLQHKGLSLDGRLTGLLNGLLLWIPFLALLALYRSLRLLGSPRIWSGLAAGCILLANPQWIRLAGHYGLAYPLLPILIWLLLELRMKARSPSMARSCAIGLGILLLTVAAGMLHPYHLALFLVVLGSAGIWSLLEKHWREAFVQFGTAVLGYVAFSAFSSIGGQPDDRPRFPYGFLEARIEWPMMVWSRWMPGLGLNPGNPRFLEFELNTYLGLLPLVGILLLPFMLVSIWRALQSPRFRAKKLLEDQVPNSQKRALGLLLFLTLAGWCMASFFPFSLAGDSLTDAMPALRQFRILARFAWLAYYAWTLAFAAWIGQLLTRTNQDHAARATCLWVTEARWNRPCRALWHKSIPNAMVLPASLVLAGVWAADAYFHTQPVFALIHQPIDGVYLNTEEDYPAWLERCGYRASDFQAILALPYFHIGSEQFLIQGTTQIKNAAFSASLQTGLPLLNVDMSRTSYHQALTQLQLLNRDGACFRSHLPDERPLLLLSHPRQMDEHSRRLLSRSDSLGTTNALSLHILPLERLDPSFKERLAQPPTTTHNFRSKSPKNSSRAYVEFASHLVHANPKVLNTDSTGTHYGAAPDSNLFTLSFWMRDRLDLAHMPSLIVEGYSASGERLWQRTRPLYGRPWDIACEGPWIRIDDSVHWGSRVAEIRWALDQDSVGIQWQQE